MIPRGAYCLSNQVGESLAVRITVVELGYGVSSSFSSSRIGSRVWVFESRPSGRRFVDRKAFRNVSDVLFAKRTDISCLVIRNSSPIWKTRGLLQQKPLNSQPKCALIGGGQYKHPMCGYLTLCNFKFPFPVKWAFVTLFTGYRHTSYLFAVFEVHFWTVSCSSCGLGSRFRPQFELLTGMAPWTHEGDRDDGYLSCPNIDAVNAKILTEPNQRSTSQDWRG